MDYLSEPKEELDVISIVGIAGLGKTTLAGKIYQNERICYEFPIRIWGHVSGSSNYRNVFLNILKMFTRQDMSSLSDAELSESARACLEKEKFLLVLDGVSSRDDWKAIQPILPRSNGRSKILITSRDDVVGADVNRKSGHELRFLTIEESWELLQLEVFGNLEDCPLELQGIGQLIAGKCSGLPLQIVVVGGILVGQLMKSHALDIKMEWEKVSKNENLFSHGEKSISKAVELIYSTLDDDLRECFLYMGVFPEGDEISVWTLTSLWIAEGFTHPEDGQSLEETASQNLYDLISMNLVVVDKINHTGEVKTCRVPHMIRAFCIDKAREQNLFQEIERWEGALEPPELQNPRRLCVRSNVHTLLFEVPAIPIPRVRSFLCFYNEPVHSNPRYVSRISDAFILLRVLASRYIKFNHFPTRITQLIHLRYITLFVDDLHILPQSFSDLWNLQTLVVDTRSRLITMEANIWKLIRLRHLKTKAAIVLSSEAEAGKAGENLQTLNTLSPKSCTEDVSEKARNLKTLRIRGELPSVFGSKFLEKLVRLEKLKLVNDFFPKIACENPLLDLPLPSCFPPSLRCLTLSKTFLKWNHMSTLAKINTLEVLKLKDNAFTGIYWSVEEDCFRSLHFLLIANADLVIWEASTDSLPTLRCLVLKNCGNLNEFPVALKNLEKLEIERVNKSAVMLGRRIAEQKAMSSIPFKLSITPQC